MKQFFKYFVLFSVGGIAYMIIEVLFSGDTHWTMGVLGGICFILIGLIDSTFGFDMPLIKQMLISSVIITSLEFISGVILNIILKLNVWDYSALPLNLLGQISLLFTLFWFVLSFPAIMIDDFIRWKLFDEPKPHYFFFQKK